MDVVEKVKEGRKRWQLLREIEPGHRFQTRYHSHRRRRERGETWKYGRILNLVGGSALIAAGFAFLPTPGPSYIIIVIGLWMLAGEVLLLARLFDRSEMRLRELGRWIKDIWTNSSTMVRLSIVLAILTCVVALGYWLII
ncbi:MAG TPA: PGPGW domain-containing protein [Rubrobacter sp.]|nr:PGPGW domain-containing protein [Rubrobacter sp.]